MKSKRREEGGRRKEERKNEERKKEEEEKKEKRKEERKKEEGDLHPGSVYWACRCATGIKQAETKMIYNKDNLITNKQRRHTKGANLPHLGQAAFTRLSLRWQGGSTLRCLAAFVPLWILCTFILLSCSNENDEREAVGSQGVVFTVAEQGWNGERMSVTRVGETLEGLKAVGNPAAPADGEGFGVYSSLLFLDNAQRQVVWNNSTAQWQMGYDVYWKRPYGESTFNVYAYAPYKSTPYTWTEVTTPVDSRTGQLSFTSDSEGNNVDLLYAGDEVHDNVGIAELTFRHALAKLSFGTISNYTGSDITLTQISVTGYLHQSAKLELMTGAWSEQTTSSQTITRNDFDRSSAGNQTLAIAQANFATIDINPLLLIPGPDVTITLTLSGGTTYSYTTTLEQGKNKIFNITLEKNFEVVIE